MNSGRWTEEEVETVKTYLKAGYLGEEIAALIGRKHKSVRQMMMRRKLSAGYYPRLREELMELVNSGVSVRAAAADSEICYHTALIWVRQERDRVDAYCFGTCCRDRETCLRWLEGRGKSELGHWTDRERGNPEAKCELKVDTPHPLHGVPRMNRT
jgi:hypothetical protein